MCTKKMEVALWALILDFECGGVELQEFDDNRFVSGRNVVDDLGYDFVDEVVGFGG